MASTYHVAFVNPTTGVNQTTVDVATTANLQVENYLKQCHGKFGSDFGFPSIANTAAQATALDTLATNARRYSSAVMFVTWDG